MFLRLVFLELAFLELAFLEPVFSETASDPGDWFVFPAPSGGPVWRRIWCPP